MDNLFLVQVLKSLACKYVASRRAEYEVNPSPAIKLYEVNQHLQLHVFSNAVLAFRDSGHHG